MDDKGFSWDDSKAAANVRKHRVPFDEAMSVFFDARALEFFDPDHSRAGERCLMLGLSWRMRVLVVSYCLRAKGSEIRIISARRATKKERAVYTGQRL